MADVRQAFCIGRRIQAGFVCAAFGGGDDGVLGTSSGVPFSRFSEAWDELQGWQRGVLGVAIFVVAVVVIMGGFMMIA